MSLLLLALAQAATAATPPQSVKAVPAKDKMVCRTEEVMGSRIQSKQICMTKAEYEQYRMDVKSDLNRAQKTGYFQR